MDESTLLVLGFCTWTTALLLGLGLFRILLTITGKHPANKFQPSGEDVSAFSNRLCRAHANCYENLPVVLGIILYAYMTNQIAITNTFALIFLGLRIGQSLVHIASTNIFSVLLRFTLFAGQYLIVLYWLTKLWGIL